MSEIALAGRARSTSADRAERAERSERAARFGCELCRTFQNDQRLEGGPRHRSQAVHSQWRGVEFGNLQCMSRTVRLICMCPEDFETATGLSLVRTKLERQRPRACLDAQTSACYGHTMTVMKGCMLKDHELPLSDVLQAKAFRNSDRASKRDNLRRMHLSWQVCAIRAMAEATVAYKFENDARCRYLPGLCLTSKRRASVAF